MAGICTSGDVLRDAGGDPVDGGEPRDAGTADAGSRDGGIPDAGDPIVERCDDPISYPTDGWEARYYTLAPGPDFGDCFGVVDVPGESLAIDFMGGAPLGSIHASFTSRFSSSRTFEPGVHTMELEHDDGIRVYVDDTLVYENWTHGHVPSARIETPYLTAGEHRITVEHFDDEGFAQVAVSWTRGCVTVPTDDRWRLTYYALDGANAIDTSECYGRATINDPDIDLAEPAGMPADRYAIVGETVRDLGGATRFSATHDDGLRVFVDGAAILDDWLEGPVRSIGTVRSYTGARTVRFEKANYADDSQLMLSWRTTCADRPPPQTDGWFVAYYPAVFDGMTWDLDRTRCIGAEIVAGGPLDWTQIPDLPANAGFTESWGADYFGTRTFGAQTTVMLHHDDGLRVYSGANLVYEDWRAPNVVLGVPIAFAAGTHPIRLEYFEASGGEQLRFLY